jgi:hypothetical protein
MGVSMNFKPLISEKDDKGEYENISLGRIAFWLTFGIAIYVWTMGTGDIQASHLQMLYLTTTYNLMKKATFLQPKKEEPKDDIDETLRRR